MPLTIGTNAYSDLAGAEAYFALRYPRADAWEAASADDRTRALVAATAAVDRLSFAGMVTRQDQRLAWPRINVCDREGRPVPSDTVPDAVQAAACEFALHLLTTPQAREGAPIQRKQVGDLSITYRASLPDPVPGMVRALLAPFLLTTPHSVALVL